MRAHRHRSVAGLPLRIARMLPCLLPVAAACSELPSRAWPRMDERRVVAEYAVAAGRSFEVPVSSADLTILSLETTPPPAAELWQAGHHFLVPPTGCDRVLVTCSYRAYERDGALPAPTDLFPGARVTTPSP